MMPERLTNQWVTLEPLAAAHFDDLKQAADDPRIWTLAMRSGYGPEFAGWFEEAIAGGNRQAYVVRTPAGVVVGSSSLLDLNRVHRTVEIGHTWYAVDAQGTAVNPASKRLLLGHCFETLGLNRVQFMVDARNARSQAAVLKLGATREGLLRHHRVTYTGWMRDTAVFSILSSEWPGVRERLNTRLGSVTS